MHPGNNARRTSGNAAQGARVALHAEGAADAIYTCPMHSQVRQIGPGHCPICGMALEPLIASADEGDSPELRDMTRRFWIALVLTPPVVALGMGGHLLGSPFLPAQSSNWGQLGLGPPALL